MAFSQLLLSWECSYLERQLSRIQDSPSTFAGPLTACWPPLLWASLGFPQAPRVTSASLRSRFLFHLSTFDCNMSGCGSLCVHPNWHLLSTLSIQMRVSHQLWGAVSHDFFDSFFLPFLSLLLVFRLGHFIFFWDSVHFPSFPFFSVLHTT